MIEHMLVDLGLAGQAFRDWSSDTSVPTSPRSRTMRCPIPTHGSIHGRSRSTCRRRWTRRCWQVATPYRIVRTYARDDTWTGAIPPKIAPHVLVAEFGHAALLYRARAQWPRSAVPPVSPIPRWPT
jgi:hypothetical protein